MRRDMLPGGILLVERTVMGTITKTPPIPHAAPSSPGITDRLLSIIRASGFSLRQLAALSSIPPETLRRYISRGDMPITSFLAIARALRLDPAAVLVDDAGTVTEARRIADLIAPLGPAERSALRGLLEAAVELRTAAVYADRLHAGDRPPRPAPDVLALPTTDDEPHTPEPTGRRRRKGR